MFASAYCCSALLFDSCEQVQLLVVNMAIQMVHISRMGQTIPTSNNNIPVTPVLYISLLHLISQTHC